ncbi:MAG: hypothetical protein IPK16_03950 [Anaerolineales bacterium]|nr:hypothetical protein [Anaerolineales bacterium]
MGVLIQIVATYAPYIYLVCGLIALYQLYRLVQVRADRRQAVFTLERERAMRELYGIFTGAIGLLLVMGFTYFASRTLPQAAASEAQNATPEPTLPPEFSLQIVPTNTPLFATPSVTPTSTPTPEPATPTPDPAQATALAATAAALPATPTTAPAPAVAAAPANCPDPRSVITAPGNGETVSGVFSLFGTASHEQFDFYKVEFAPGADATGGFTYLADGRSQVFGGALASVDTRGLSNGPWTFQLTVVDVTSNYPDQCRVTVNVQN